MACPVDGSRQCDPICSGCGGPSAALTYFVAMHAEMGQELFVLPRWAWLRRRKAWQWRRHYAMRIADEMEAAGSDATAVIQVACDRCTQGVMDSTNPHMLGRCSCSCHAPNGAS